MWRLYEHAVQSLLSTCLFGFRSWSHTKPHHTQINIGVLIRKLSELTYNFCNSVFTFVTSLPVVQREVTKVNTEVNKGVELRY